MNTSRKKLSLAVMLLAGSLPATTVLAGMMDGNSQSGIKKNPDHMKSSKPANKPATGMQNKSGMMGNSQRGGMSMGGNQQGGMSMGGGQQGNMMQRHRSMMGGGQQGGMMQGQRGMMGGNPQGGMMQPPAPAPGPYYAPAPNYAPAPYPYYQQNPYYQPSPWYPPYPFNGMGYPRY